MNRDDNADSGDTWSRDSKHGRQGDFHGINYFGIAIVIIGIVLYFVVS